MDEPDGAIYAPAVGGERIGITCDVSNNSLWLSGYNTGTTPAKIENNSLSGTLLSSFTVAHPRTTSLALDPADGTLWLNSADLNSGALTLEQYSRASGTLLDSEVFTGPVAFGNYVGAEFQYTVVILLEPGSAALLSTVIGLLALRRRRDAV